MFGIFLEYPYTGIKLTSWEEKLMVWFRRIALFLTVNILVVLTISVVMSVLNVQPYLTRHGLDLGALLIFCLIWGMTGAFISLMLSRVTAKWLMDVEVINPNTMDSVERQLLDTVYRLARKAGLSTMPEVGIYHSSEVNAFATGPTQSRSLVAVSSGLLRRLNSTQVEGVLGHEIAHIANGDMVTMTLLQGVVNAFVMFLARALAYILLRGDRKEESSERSMGGYYYLLVFVFEIVFMLLGSMVIAYYSRFREFRADKGGACLAGKEKMISALEALHTTLNIEDPKAQNNALQAFKISGGKNFLQLFSTHPPLEVRIQRLKEITVG